MVCERDRRMDKRKQDILDLETYIERADNDLCLILQSLQWDKNKTLQSGETVVCDHDKNHKIPIYNLYEHEKKCVLKAEGYVEDDILLPPPAYPTARNCVEFSNKDIEGILHTACKSNPKKILGDARRPMTLSRIQTTFTQHERRAIYEAVLSSAPPQLIDDVDLIPSCTSKESGKPKSRLELLAEQRDMKRRRTKYRVTTKHKNYSQVLREVIHNQMELYLESQQHLKPSAEERSGTSNGNKHTHHKKPHKDRDNGRSDSQHRKRSKSRRHSEDVEHRRRRHDEGGSDYKERDRRYKERDTRPHRDYRKDDRGSSSHKKHNRS